MDWMTAAYDGRMGKKEREGQGGAGESNVTEASSELGRLVE